MIKQPSHKHPSSIREEINITTCTIYTKSKNHRPNLKTKTNIKIKKHQKQIKKKINKQHHTSVQTLNKTTIMRINYNINHVYFLTRPVITYISQSHSTPQAKTIQYNLKLSSTRPIQHNTPIHITGRECMHPIYGRGRCTATKQNTTTTINHHSGNNDNITWQTTGCNILQKPNEPANYTNGNSIETWRPSQHLPYKFTHHPLINNIGDETPHTIKNLCQQSPTTPFRRSTKRNSVEITIKHLQELISYGQEVNDHIMYLYLEMVCHIQCAFLYTDFIPRLKQTGWTDAKRYFANPNRRNRSRAPEKPNKTGERAILIPAFINDSHWTGIVRREIKDRVMFLYADDMNNKNDEINMQQLLQNTDNEFYPADAIWINCSNNLYLPHSNECGPRTLLALTIMCAHPAPYREMLQPQCILT